MQKKGIELRECRCLEEFGALTPIPFWSLDLHESASSGVSQATKTLFPYGQFSKSEVLVIQIKVPKR